DWNVGARFDGLEQGVGYDWTPDGKTIVFDGLREADADYRYRESQVYAVDASTGAVRQLTTRRGNWNHPVVSPDGRSVAFTGYDYTPQTYKTDELFVMGIDGAGIRQISGDLDRDVTSARWSPDGTGLYFAAGDRGTSNIYLASVKGGASRVTEGAHVLSLSSIGRDWTAVGIRADSKEPGDVVRVSLRAPKDISRLTSVNNAVLATKRLAQLKEFSYPSNPGA